jgi:hypothetical protein
MLACALPKGHEAFKVCHAGRGAILNERKAIKRSAKGYNARNDEIRDNVTRMQREWEAQRGALATFPPKAMFGSGPRSPPLSPQSITG